MPGWMHHREARGVNALMHPLAAAHRIDGESGEVFVGVHGFTGSPAHLRMLAQHVHEAHGHTVLLPRLAGHGTSMADMATTGFMHWSASVREAVRVAFEISDTVHLLGFSMGGLLALDAAGEFPIRTLMTLNTPLVGNTLRVQYARLMAPFVRYRMWPDGGNVPVDEAREYWLQYEGMPTRCIPELDKARRAAKNGLSRVTAPTLIIQSVADETVDPKSAGMLAAGLNRTEVEILWLETSPHNALLYGERDLIHAAVSSHIESGGGAD